MGDPTRIEAILWSSSQRQCQVLYWVCQGLEYPAVALKLNFSESTVQLEMSRLYGKLGLREKSTPEKRRILMTEVCPVLTRLMTNPTESIGQVEVPESEPDPEALAEVKADVVAGLIPLYQSLIPIPREKPGEEPNRERGLTKRRQQSPVVVVPAGQTPPRNPPILWFLFGVLATLLVVAVILLLTRQPVTSPPLPTAPGVFTPATAFSTQQAAIATAPSQTPLPTYTQPPTQTPLPTYTQPAQSTATSQPTATPTLAVTLPFVDTFDLRARPEWQIQTGTWRVVDGHFTATTGNGPQTVLVGDEAWRDYSVEVNAYSDQWFWGVRILVRVTDEGYLAFHVHDTLNEWYVVRGGKEQQIAQGRASFNPSQSTISIKVTARGDIFTGYVNGTQASQVQDTTFDHGRVGLSYDSAYFEWFDNFRVTEEK